MSTAGNENLRKTRQAVRKARYAQPGYKPRPGFKGGAEWKGNRLGRPRGSQNKITTDLKAAIIMAAHETGFDGKGKDGLAGYLRWLSMVEPRSFSSLLGKLVPLQIVGSFDPNSATMTRDEVMAKLRERGLPFIPIFGISPESVRGTVEEIKTVTGSVEDVSSPTRPSKFSGVAPPRGEDEGKPPERETTVNPDDVETTVNPDDDGDDGPAGTGRVITLVRR